METGTTGAWARVLERREHVEDLLTVPGLLHIGQMPPASVRYSRLRHLVIRYIVTSRHIFRSYQTDNLQIA